MDNAFPFVTVFNGRAEIDVTEAAPEGVAALPHMNPNLAQADRGDPKIAAPAGGAIQKAIRN